MAIQCPLCKKNTLKKRGDTLVFCGSYQPHKNDNGQWTNQGNCEFHIGLKNKVFGKISISDVKSIVNGSIVTNKKGDKIKLDLESTYFTKIEFAPKEEDEDL